jgi:ATP-dependent RNA helicase RhlE
LARARISLKENLLKTFKELNLIEPIERALAEQNYVIPTPIQAQTIPAAIEGVDVLGCAQTGTGKTAAFALPILNYLGEEKRNVKPNRPLALILAPTRELAIQIGDSFATYGKHLKLRTMLVYGGVNQNSQVKSLNQGAHIVVATPGRLLDLMNQGFIKLEDLEVFVLDEADRMMDMGFLPDLKRIIRELPEERQSLFFSATMPPKIQQLAQSMLWNPITVNVTPQKTSVERIEQGILFVEKTGKQNLLQRVLLQPEVERAIVFTRTKRGANMVAERLGRNGIKAAAIHGNKSQNARQRALDAFRKKFVQVLVATDVAARGIDIDGVTHVVNFDLPNEPESYVHRIGRTGRAGAEGIALSFCSSDERTELRDIERLIGMKIPAAADQPQPDPQDAKRSPRPSGGSIGGPRSSGRRSANRSSQGSNSNRNRTRRSTVDSGGSVESVPPKQQRRRRAGRNERTRSKQAT